MKFNPDIHHRRSIRLQEYDYSANGAYFVTICTQGRECLFGDSVDGVMRLNDAGQVLETWWQKLPTKFDAVKVDAHIIMPNHFHGIVRIVGAPPRGCPDVAVTENIVQPNEVEGSGRPHGIGKEGRPHGAGKEGRPHGIGKEEEGRPHGAGKEGRPHGAAPTLGDVMDWFKTMTTNAYIRGVKESGWTPFPGRLWQRNYYERIIRNDVELAATREYIVYNPMKWAEDDENSVT